MKYLAAALIVLLALLQYRWLLGEGSVREVARLREEIAAQKLQNESLRERNRTLAAEVQDLKKGTVAIEERARTDLGMIGTRETFYQIVTPEQSVAAPDPSEPQEE